MGTSKSPVLCTIFFAGLAGLERVCAHKRKGLRPASGRLQLSWSKQRPDKHMEVSSSHVAGHRGLAFQALCNRMIPDLLHPLGFKVTQLLPDANSDVKWTGTAERYVARRDSRSELTVIFGFGQRSCCCLPGERGELEPQVGCSSGSTPCLTDLP